MNAPTGEPISGNHARDFPARVWRADARPVDVPLRGRGVSSLRRDPGQAVSSAGSASALLPPRAACASSLALPSAPGGTSGVGLCVRVSGGLGVRCASASRRVRLVAGASLGRVFSGLGVRFASVSRRVRLVAGASLGAWRRVWRGTLRPCLWRARRPLCFRLAPRAPRRWRFPRRLAARPAPDLGA
jgi:hypothetical protein